MIIDRILYFISRPDDIIPNIRLNVPSHLRDAVKQQYHYNNVHCATDRLAATIAEAGYYWPNQYKDLHNYVKQCLPCQSHNMQSIKPFSMTTDILPYPFAKASLDVAGPFPTTLSGNRIVVTFLDLFSG